MSYTMKKTKAFALLSGSLLVALAVGVASLSTSCSLPYRWTGDYQSSSFESNGERIYFTAESSSGAPIRYSGESTMMRNRTACVDCHGPEGKGGRVTMMMWSFKTPDITWDKLAQEENHKEDSGKDEHEEHPPYTEETLKRAITRGDDPAGEPLDELMPRWRMSEPDLDDLVEFIKTLK